MGRESLLGRFTPTRTAALICLTLLTTFVVLAWASVSQKSPTVDEPLKASAAWVITYLHDFRVSPEDPPLWMRWAAIAYTPTSFSADTTQQTWRRMPDELFTAHWEWSKKTLFQTPGVDGQALVNRARTMMLIFGVALGALICIWSWQLGGPVAAVTATAAFALDPNFLANAPLMKNDVALSFFMLAVMWGTWMIGRRGHWPVAAGLLLFAAAATCVKFSGLVAIPLVIAALLVRSIHSRPWRLFGVELTTRLARLVGAAGISAALIAATYAMIWACYGFRFDPTDDPTIRLNTDSLVQSLEQRQRAVGAAQSADKSWNPPPGVRAALFIERHRLLPQAWVAGVIHTICNMTGDATYLNGNYSDTGWWYYFPLAILFKTPLATLAMLGLLPVVLWLVRPLEFWSWFCLIVPPAVFLISAMHSNLNIGLRHILPVYPSLFIGIGAAAARAWQLKRRIARPALLLLGAGLAVESLAAFPNFIPFFNFAAGGSRGGLERLGGSNLDWGQDLPALVQWQQRHPDVPLYLSYFGPADASFYGLVFRDMRPIFRIGDPPPPPAEPGVVAISATNLQGIYLPPRGRQAYGLFRHRKPREVLNGSIYLFDWPLQ